MIHVSIITITQHKRFSNLKQLYHIIQQQLYLQIKEWVIVEGSQSIELHNENTKQIQEFINEREDQTDIHMRFISGSILPLSDLRNLGNDNCKGEVIICMDDDDYYPPEYIPNIVSMFNKYNNRLIAGCSNMYFYDFDLDKLYKCKGFHNDHSTNNCMAYKKEYLKDHRYDTGLSFGEEYSFTNGFTEPMIQIDPDKSVIVIIHDSNTVNKKDYVKNKKYILEIFDIKINTLIPKEIFTKMKEVFMKMK